MDDAALVRRFERIGDLTRKAQRLVERQWSSRRSTSCERLAFDKLHDDARTPSGFGEAEHVRDVGVIERRQHFGLALETRESIGDRP